MADSISPALRRLIWDSDGLSKDDIVDATNVTMQQLLPGENHCRICEHFIWTHLETDG